MRLTEPVPTLAGTPLLRSEIATPLDDDARRAALLVATRRMSVSLMVALPLFVVALVALWSIRAETWTRALIAVVCALALGSCAVTAELWRRLGRLSDLSILNEELRYRASHDLLMHVPNRDLLHVELARALTASRGKPGRVGLLFLDLDHFKFVNDSLGHAAGDELLKAVGRRIERALSDDNALLARVGGDELVVLMRSLTSPQHIGQVADRLLGTFDHPFTIDGVKLSVGASIGVAVSVTGDTADELYRHADAALYEAKERGRAQAVLADLDLRAKRDARVRTELALRGALEDRRIEAWYQPEVDMVTGEIVAAEALARWRTSDGVEVASSFIGVARRAGMLEQLMVDMAGQIWDWRQQAAHELPVALNVSAAHLSSLLALANDRAGDRPLAGVRIEIAETDIIHDFSGARLLLSRLRSMGACIMLDDFGAGYSSLQMLSDLPIDGLKIDRSYVARIDSDPRVRNLVTSLAEFARSTDMLVVAEGVETPLQADFLTRIGIDRGQGYLFSRAVDADRFDALLAAGPLGPNLSARF